MIRGTFCQALVRHWLAIFPITPHELRNTLVLGNNPSVFGSLRELENQPLKCYYIRN